MKNKKTLEYYMSLPYSFEFVPDPDEGGYAVRFPDLNGCLTVGETIQQAYDNAMDAKLAWLSSSLNAGVDIPEPSESDDIKTEQLVYLFKKLSPNRQSELLSFIRDLVNSEKQKNKIVEDNKKSLLSMLRAGYAKGLA